MDSVLNLYKERGETPRERAERYARARPEYKGQKLTYAGRLDPMAEGVLIVLTGGKTKERDTYTSLSKDYEFEFMLGIETDTFDILGEITGQSANAKAPIEKIEAALAEYRGAFSQKYPPYSSKVIDGTPMFELARKKALHTVTIPEHEVEVMSLTLDGVRTASKADLEKEILNSIGKVTGDFRQKSIAARWKKYFSETQREEFEIFRAKVSCGSGFYVRQLVSDLGADLGTGACTFSILRTRVGHFDISASVREAA